MLTCTCVPPITSNLNPRNYDNSISLTDTELLELSILLLQLLDLLALAAHSSRQLPTINS